MGGSELADSPEWASARRREQRTEAVRQRDRRMTIGLITPGAADLRGVPSPPRSLPAVARGRAVVRRPVTSAPLQGQGARVDPPRTPLPGAMAGKGKGKEAAVATPRPVARTPLPVAMAGKGKGKGAAVVTPRSVAVTSQPTLTSVVARRPPVLLRPSTPFRTPIHVSRGAEGGSSGSKGARIAGTATGGATPGGTATGGTATAAVLPLAGGWHRRPIDRSEVVPFAAMMGLAPDWRTRGRSRSRVGTAGRGARGLRPVAGAPRVLGTGTTAVRRRAQLSTASPLEWGIAPLETPRGDGGTGRGTNTRAGTVLPRILYRESRDSSSSPEHIVSVSTHLVSGDRDTRENDWASDSSGPSIDSMLPRAQSDGLGRLGPKRQVQLCSVTSRPGLFLSLEQRPIAGSGTHRRSSGSSSSSISGASSPPVVGVG
jgi:hypothetical protein